MLLACEKNEEEKCKKKNISGKTKRKEIIVPDRG